MGAPILFIGSPIGPLSGPSRRGGPEALFCFLTDREAPRKRLLSSAKAPLLVCSISSGGPRFLVDTNNIAQMIEPSLAAMGYRLVRVLMTGGRRATLQVMAERLDDLPITHDDCTEISRSVSSLLDVADPIAGAYTLEISSPGIDRPLVRVEDYDRFSGFEAKIELAMPLNGRRRFRGCLIGTAEGVIRLLIEEGEVRLPLDAVVRAKLVITDDLIATRQRTCSEPHPPQAATPPSNSLTRET
jgi:ribosome maturation factor RimP